MKKLIFYLYSYFQKKVINQLELYPPFTISQLNPSITFGPIPRTKNDVTQLKNNKVTHIISLNQTHELEAISPHLTYRINKEFQRYIFPVLDFSPPSQEQLLAINNYFQEEIKKNPNARFYIHCYKGIGRSATTALTLKMMQENKEPHDIITNAKKEFPQISLNPSQKSAIIEFYLNAI